MYVAAPRLPPLPPSLLEGEEWRTPLDGSPLGTVNVSLMKLPLSGIAASGATPFLLIQIYIILIYNNMLNKKSVNLMV